MGHLLLDYQLASVKPVQSVVICDPVCKGLLPVGHSAALVHVHGHIDRAIFISSSQSLDACQSIGNYIIYYII